MKAGRFNVFKYPLNGSKEGFTIIFAHHFHMYSMLSIALIDLLVS